jgi:hypothetical protein
MKPISCVAFTVVVVVASASCSNVQSRDENSSTLQAPRATAPAPLTGAARDAMRRALEEHGDPDRADLRTPGTVTRAPDERLAYDRYLVIGSTLTTDRGEAMREFLASLERDNASFVIIESPQGSPTKVLVNYEGLRYVVAVGQW